MVKSGILNTNKKYNYLFSSFVFLLPLWFKKVRLNVSCAADFKTTKTQRTQS